MLIWRLLHARNQKDADNELSTHSAGRAAEEESAVDRQKDADDELSTHSAGRAAEEESAISVIAREVQNADDTDAESIVSGTTTSSIIDVIPVWLNIGYCIVFTHGSVLKLKPRFSAETEPKTKTWCLNGLHAVDYRVKWPFSVHQIF